MTDRSKLSKPKITDLQNENVILMNYLFLFLKLNSELARIFLLFKHPNFNLSLIRHIYGAKL